MNIKRRVDPEIEAHRAWLGLLQPLGVVVAPAALVSAQVVPDKNIAPVQNKLRDVLTTPEPAFGQGDGEAVLSDFPLFAQNVLGWSPDDLAGADGGPQVPERLSVALPDYGETLRPDYAVLDAFSGDEPTVVMLVSVVETGVNLDTAPRDKTSGGWPASPQARLERMLRESDVPAGLLCNGATLRLVYAPRGESSGHLDFPVAEMLSVGGRPILSAMHMLLSEYRVFSADDGARLLDLMAESRKYQSEVSNRLSEQVLEGLWALLRGFQAADEAVHERLLGELRRNAPESIYGGLLTLIMRLVFLLYAEDQGLMPDSEIYLRNYSVSGLYERLREDAANYPDTMDQRFGAYAWLLSTFRLMYDGGRHGDLVLPARHGQLFNPDAYPFLEGRPVGVGQQVTGEPFEVPRVSDGVLWRVLEGLLVLDGERLSYRALDVEQIGSVYESMMGFEVQTAEGRSVAVRPKHVVIDLDELLAQPGVKRKKWLKEHGDCDVSGKAATALKNAETIDDLVAALDRRVSAWTPRPLPPGSLFLQPGEERRRSGSHYTPRELTEPIVREALRPVLKRLGDRPTPENILDLKVCDPAMGSGAFLVESCRQLASALVDAWELHNATPEIPDDEDPLLHARRLVAQRCLCGVDKNRFAVDLAKLSLWLVTLAHDHAFTFLDHALRRGDSLVGLTLQQIKAFDWKARPVDWSEAGPLLERVTKSVQEVSGLRNVIRTGDGRYDDRKAAWEATDDQLKTPRLVGDACVAAFFEGAKDKERESKRLAYLMRVGDLGEPDADSGARRGLEDDVNNCKVVPFHWDLEFTEVFDRDNPGFDAIVGNPPFAGKNTIINGNPRGYVDWLKHLHQGAHGNADLVAHFYRRAFSLVRQGGTFGLIATNTIAQGDTRASGLRWICKHGGEIYRATKRVKWPGQAAVVVSVVHVHRGRWESARYLDDKKSSKITAFLFHEGGHDDPKRLVANAGKSFIGSYVLGMGFTFDDTDKKGVASSLDEMRRLIAKDPRNAERIFPYIGGQEINSSPTQAHHRYVINFGELSEEEARRWPDLMAIVEAKVKPERMKLRDNADGRHRKEYWWLWGRYTPALYRAIAGLERVLANSQVSTRVQFAFCDANSVIGHTANVFPFDTHGAFCVLQSRVHELWARFFASTLGDGLRYTPSDCFETFPFPPGWETDAALEAAGAAYYSFRAELMVRNGEGMTKTYNRFHDPNERSEEITRLRELHGAMDRAVLDAYGWGDIPTACDFYLDYVIDEETWGSKKKPLRYRWPEEVRDEVLARLMKLNEERYDAEETAGLHGEKRGGKKGRRVSKRGRGGVRGKAKKRVNAEGQQSLSLFNGRKPDD